MGRRAAALIFAGVVLGCGSLTKRAEAQSAPSSQPQQLAEIDVIGERPGPRLWKVSKGDHVLWLLGTLTHIPKRMTWRSKEVESTLADSQELLDNGLAVSADVGPITAVRMYFQWRRTEKNPDRTTLKTWVPAALYQRFEALKANFDGGDQSIEELRPSLAALRLYDKAVDAAGLTQRDDVEREVVKLAKRRRVPVVRAKLQVTDPSAALKEVGNLSPSLEIDCLAATVTRIESDLQNMQQRATAWSVGDVDRLRALPFPNQREVCITALSSSPRVKAMVDDASNSWLAEAESALNRNRVSFAMRPIYELLGGGGLLATFRREGYQIEGP